ncbi:MULTISPECIES: hypothetical protein [unclassified Streptomyces]|uniref:hypothetical protein n=1 Tax=unclassified Streptomyces TaxID=2593676 RepID=UPI000F735DEE|nr:MULTISPECIES: hypothetical protein [unclassified Streptomyces]
MTTLPSSSRSNEPVIPLGAAGAPPSAGTVAATGTHRSGPPRTPLVTERADPPETVAARDPVATVDLVDPLEHTGPTRAPGPAPHPDAPAAGRPYGDPVGDLVHAAVADRPLEEVVDLITVLERSPQHTRAVVDALRAAGIDRSVEDVTRLVALLTRPPRDVGSADETIRAAAAHRSVEDVTLLVALLHNEPLAPHCREEALRAAATGRSVGELVELIDRLALHQPPEHLRRAATEATRVDGDSASPRGDAHPEDADAATPRAGFRLRRGRRPAVRDGARRTRRPRRSPATAAARARSPRPVAARPVVWSSWLVAVALAVCAVAHFPLRQDGVPLGLLASAVGLSVLCTVLALILVVRPGALALAAAVVVPTALAAAHAYGGTVPPAGLPRAVDLALAPTWLAMSAALAAAVLALTALVVRVIFPSPGAHWTWPPPEPHGVAD